MKKCIIFLIIFLFFYQDIAISSPPILFFKKSIKTKNTKKVFFKYRIKEGEYIYSILRSLNIPKNRFGYVLREIKRLNPQIKDLSKLCPGQCIKIPIDVLPKNEPISYISYKIDIKKYPYVPRKYVIKKGEYIVELLNRIGGIPKNLIFNEYLYIFKRLNPYIKDINNIAPGTTIILPIRHPLNSMSTSLNPVSKIEDLFNSENIQKDLSLNILVKLGFSIRSTGTIIYPLQDGDWISINCDNTPIVEDHEGEKIVLLSGNQTYEYYIKDNVYSSNIIFCRLLDWQPYEVLKDISTYVNSIKLWDRGKDLIIIGDNFVLESWGDLQVVKKKINGDNSYYIFFLDHFKITYPLKLLISFLSKENIHIYFLGDTTNSFIEPHVGLSNILYLPKISEKGKRYLSFHRYHLQTIRMGFEKNKLSISIKVNRVDGLDNNSIYFLDQDKPYLIALLRAKGYDCYLRE